MDRTVTFILALFVAFLSMYIWQVYQASHEHPILDGVDIPDPLEEHSEEFGSPEVIKVTEGVHVAVGFAIANSIMLEGEDGIIIVDTTESPIAGAEILREFRNITSKPIKAIIVTHNHVDHGGGVEAFIEDENDPPPIIAHELISEQIARLVRTNKRVARGASYQFGTSMNDNSGALVNAGLGPKLRLDPSRVRYFRRPDTLVDGNFNKMEIAGIQIELVHIPGETPDQLGVWWPERRVFLPADDIYKTFPNLYAIRGTPSRHVLVWAKSLQKIMDLKPEFLVPSHTKPLSGETEIHKKLSIYRDAILFVHDQTVRYVNKGFHPDEIAKIVKFPPSLANERYLQEFYGTVEWSVKGVYNQYVGWFSGDANDLHPLTPTEQAERMVKLVGVKQLLDEASDAIAVGDYKWALQTVSYVFKARPDETQARELRLQILRKLASKEISPNGRHFYLTTALDDHNQIDWTQHVAEHLKRNPLDVVFEGMKMRLKAEAVVELSLSVVFNFTDIPQSYLLSIENSVLHVTKVDSVTDDSVDVIMTTSSLVFRALLVQERNPVSAYMTGDLQVKGSLFKLKHFMDSFERGKKAGTV